jgi:hypothetical protein
LAYLDNNGVLYLWGKIKAHVSAAINAIVIPSKTSDLTNDSGFITSADVPPGASASTTTPKMDGTAAVGSETAFARGDHVHPSDTSKVDKVSGYGLVAMREVVNGYELHITGETATSIQVVGITDYNTTMQQAMTVLAGKADASELSNYALKSDISSMYKYKGSVATVSDLPSSDNTTGDVYNVESTGMNYAWNGSAWDALGETFSITAITNAEIDTICT